MYDAQKSALKVVVILVMRFMEYMLVSLLLSLVRYGFVWGCFHGPSCIVLKMLQVFIRVSRGGGSVLWIPLKIAEL